MFKLESYLSLMCTPKIWVALTEQINNYYDQFLHGRTAVEKVVLMYLLEERKKEEICLVQNYWEENSERISSCNEE